MSALPMVPVIGMDNIFSCLLCINSVVNQYGDCCLVFAFLISRDGGIFVFLSQKRIYDERVRKAAKKIVSVSLRVGG